MEHSTASGLVHPQPKQGSKITALLGPGKWRKEFFSPLVAGETQTCDLAINNPQLQKAKFTMVYNTCKPEYTTQFTDL